MIAIDVAIWVIAAVQFVNLMITVRQNYERKKIANSILGLAGKLLDKAAKAIDKKTTEVNKDV